MSLPPDVFLLPPFDALTPAEETALDAAGSQLAAPPFLPQKKDHTFVALLLAGRAIVSRNQVAERLIEAPTILDLTPPAPLNEPEFYPLEPSLIAWIPRVKVDAIVPASKRLPVHLEQVRAERKDLADLVDRQGWVWSDTPHLPATPYSGELDYMALVIQGMPVSWTLPADTTPLSNRVVALIGVHTAGSSGSPVLPPGAVHGAAWLLVPVQQDGVARYHVVAAWTDQLTVLHLMRERYGVQLAEGRVFDGDSPDLRLLAFSERVRWQGAFSAPAASNPGALATETGVPWDATNEGLPLSFGFERSGFGMGPALSRPCAAHLSLAYLGVQSVTATSTSLDATTFSGGAVVAGFRLKGQFVLQLPKARRNLLRDRLKAWVIG